ncbi:MAG TPA: helix-turn-helix transcriptional regulator [Clostridiaceae bacterium]|nr:helix-turn-helix transcriptional regulator [Clostridiaceae bacterium]
MDLKKIGLFLKELRNERRLSQENFAEIFHVARRTVSRWETGRNLPDIVILIEIAEFYDLDLREILNGERKDQKMDADIKDSVLQAAQYSNEERKIFSKTVIRLFVFALILSILRIVINRLELAGKWFDFVAGFCDGFVIVTLVVGIIHSTKYSAKLIEAKQRILKK